MPTITFFNLNEEKKNRVIKAIKKEFERVPLIDMSVKNIVDSAKIARGSFYQYFETREDAIDYILEEEFVKERKVFLNILDKNAGDIFSSAYEYVDKSSDSKSLKPKYYRHILEYLKDSKTFPFKALDLDEILTQKHLEITKCESMEELKAAVNVLMTITNVTKLIIANGKTSKVDALKEYKLQLKILKAGILKED